MDGALETELQRDFGNTLKCLAPKSSVRFSRAVLDKPLIAVTNAVLPRFKNDKLLIPESIAEAEPEDRVYRLGKAAGLMLFYHSNLKLRRLFFDQEDSPEYEFWTQLNSTYGGIIATELQLGKRAANQRVEFCRTRTRAVNLEDEDMAAATGVDAGRQIYAKFGSGKFSDVLKMYHVSDVRPYFVPKEGFFEAIARGWD